MELKSTLELVGLLSIGAGGLLLYRAIAGKKKPSLKETDREVEAAPRLSFLYTDLQKTDTFPVLSPKELIQITKTQELIQAILQQTGFKDKTCQTCVIPFIEAMAAYVQLLPASERHHHAHIGGLFEHLLEVAHNALRARKGVSLPFGSQAEDVSQQKLVWTYAVLIAAMLHDINKIMDMFNIQRLPSQDHPKGLSYHVLGGSLYAQFQQNQEFTFYRVAFNSDRRYDTSSSPSLAHSLFQNIVPAIGRSWLAQTPQCMSTLENYLLEKDKEQSPFFELIKKADQGSVRTNLALNRPDYLVSSTQAPLIDRLMQALKGLLQEGKITWNRAGAIGFLTNTHVAFVSKVLADNLRQFLHESQQRGIPEDNQRIFDAFGERQKCLTVDNQRAVINIYVEIVNKKGETWRQSLTCLVFDRAFLEKEFGAVFPTQLPSVYLDTQDLNLHSSAMTAPEPVKRPLEEKRLNSLQNEQISKSEKDIQNLPQKMSVQELPQTDDNDQIELNVDSELDFLLELPQTEVGDQSQEIHRDEIIEKQEPEQKINLGTIPNIEPDENKFPSLHKQRKTTGNLTQTENEQEINMTEKSSKKNRSNGSSLKPVSIPKKDFSVSQGKNWTPAAEQFFKWLQEKIGNGSMPYNESKARVHFIEVRCESCLYIVSPVIFDQFITDTRITEERSSIQNAIVNLGVNLKDKEHGNFIPVTVDKSMIRKQPNKQPKSMFLSGVLFSPTFTAQLFESVPKPNEFLKIAIVQEEEASEMIEVKV
jgi:integrating conjugative element relaxase (TIGR03760 family)